MDSAETLADHAESLKKLGTSIGVPTENIERAVSAIKSRMDEIEAEVQKAPSPEFTGRTSQDKDTFDDAALRNLFLSLVPGR